MTNEEKEILIKEYDKSEEGISCDYCKNTLNISDCKGCPIYEGCACLD